MVTITEKLGIIIRRENRMDTRKKDRSPACPLEQFPTNDKWAFFLSIWANLGKLEGKRLIMA
jgi:hypothetical protein